MSFSWLSWIVGPPIFAAIIGIVAGRFYRERKRVTFTIGNSEDLTLPLQQQAHGGVTFKFAGEDWVNLNRATVVVRNTGNTSIKDFRFDVVIPNRHNHYQAAIGQTSPEILQNIKIDWPRQPLIYNNPIFNIARFAVTWRAWTYKSEMQGETDPKVDPWSIVFAGFRGAPVADSLACY
jgi:hypothetical protein